MLYKKLEISDFNFDKDFVKFINSYEKMYTSIYKSNSKKRKKFFDNFFFSME